MSGVPILVDASAISVLVVGGGQVATRRARALLAAGAVVRVVAPSISPALRALAADDDRLSLAERRYARADIGDAELVIAAADDRAVNAQVAADARAAHRLVSVADAPAEGSFVSVATHRAGPLVIGVSAGGLPAAAARVRNAIADRFDGRYGAALSALIGERRRRLDAGDRDGWRLAAQRLLGDDFCTVVESGKLAERLDQWR